MCLLLGGAGGGGEQRKQGRKHGYIVCARVKQAQEALSVKPGVPLTFYHG